MEVDCSGTEHGSKWHPWVAVFAEAISIRTAADRCTTRYKNKQHWGPTALIAIFSHRVPTLAVVHVLLETLVVGGSFVLVTGLHNPTLELQNFGFVVATLVFTLVLMVGMASFGLYGSRQQLAPGATLFRLSLALVFAIIAVAFIGPLLPSAGGYYTALIEAAVLAGLGVIPLRKALAAWATRGVLARPVLIIGTGDEALAVGHAVASSPGYTLLGYYPTTLSEPCRVPRRKLLSSESSLESWVREYGIKEIVVAVRDKRDGKLPLPQLLSCRLRGVQVLDLPHFFERATGQVPVESLQASWLIFGEGFRQDWGRNAVKRAFDVIASLLLLVPGLPVMLATAILIRLESPGPVLFRQERVGLGGCSFTVLKFRSMRHNAEPDGRPQWARSDDPRITRVGRFIRRTRIDELPQVINVLKGEMSFVGPRPERPYFVAQLTQQIPFYGARHTVKPGITGWAQVRYSYGASVEDAAKKLQFDLYYVKNHTLFLDLLVLIETVRVVLFAEGAR
jgi:sugar transferase (PEP-CTERM system associated)